MGDKMKKAKKRKSHEEKVSYLEKHLEHCKKSLITAYKELKQARKDLLNFHPSSYDSVKINSEYWDSGKRVIDIMSSHGISNETTLFSLILPKTVYSCKICGKTEEAFTINGLRSAQ